MAQSLCVWTLPCYHDPVPARCSLLALTMSGVLMMPWQPGAVRLVMPWGCEVSGAMKLWGEKCHGWGEWCHGLWGAMGCEVSGAIAHWDSAVPHLGGLQTVQYASKVGVQSGQEAQRLQHTRIVGSRHIMGGTIQKLVLQATEPIVIVYMSIAVLHKILQPTWKWLIWTEYCNLVSL